MISVAVMAHRKRARFVDELTARLPARVVWDQKNNRRDTGRRAWLAFDPAAGKDYVDYDFTLTSGDYKTTYKRADGPNPETSRVVTDAYEIDYTRLVLGLPAARPTPSDAKTRNHRRPAEYEVSTPVRSKSKQRRSMARQ